MPTVAMCPSCSVPLVATLAWDKKEFYCLDCGRAYEFLEPARAEVTDELIDDLSTRRKEFVDLGAKHLIPQHLQARKTSAEIEAHRATVERLHARRTVEAIN